MTLVSHNRVHRGGPFEHDQWLAEWLNTLPGVLTAVLPTGGGYYRVITSAVAVGGPVDLDRELTDDDAATLVDQLSPSERDRLRDALADVANLADEQPPSHDPQHDGPQMPVTGDQSLEADIEANAAALEPSPAPVLEDRHPREECGYENGCTGCERPSERAMREADAAEPPPAPVLGGAGDIGPVVQCDATRVDYPRSQNERQRCILELGHSDPHHYGEAVETPIPPSAAERAMDETHDEFWGRR